MTQTEAEGASYWSLQKLLDCRFYRARASGVDFVRHCKFVVRGVTFYLNDSTAKEVTKLAELIRQPEGFGHDVMPSIRGGWEGGGAHKAFSKIMLANFERISKFLINIEAREDNCNRTVHEVRFLRGYVGDSDSQNLCQQACTKLGHDNPRSDLELPYETITVGLNGLISENA